jgi:signal transduction histidine kinase/CHASE3 domain sensor protein
MPLTPTRKSYWLIGAFISVLLVLLVAVPLVLNHRTADVIAEINSKGDPSDRMNAEVQAALSHELSGLTGFQQTGDKKYADIYFQAARDISTLIAKLHGFAPQLGPVVQSRLEEMEDAIQYWHEDVENHNLATNQLPRGEFQRILFEQDHVLETAHQSSTRFNEAVGRWRGEQRKRVSNFTETFTLLSIIFASFALVAIALVVNVLKSLNATSASLEVRANEEEALRQVAHELTRAFTLDDVLSRITESAAFAAEAESVYVELVNEQRNEITCVAGYGSGVPPTGTSGPYAGSLAAEVLTTREPKIIRDVSSEAERQSIFGVLARTCGNCAALVVPLIAENENLGALFLIRYRPGYFTHAEFPRVKILADMAALAIQRALTLDRIRRMQASEHYLSEAASILASSLDYKATLKTVVQLAVPYIADWSAVHLLEGRQIRTAEAAHADPGKIAIVQVLQEKYPPRFNSNDRVARAIRTGKPQLYLDIPDALLGQDAQSEEHVSLLRQLKMKSAMVVPLNAAGETFGAMTFVTQEGRRYDASDLAFAEDVARHAALAIQNARLYTSAQDAIHSRDEAIQVRDDAIRARDEVLRVVSHDLRNPVSNIQMTTRMLMSESLPEVKRFGMLEVINRSAVRMRRLIDDLLAVARLREGQPFALEVRRENPVEIILEACELFAAQARGKSIQLECEKPRQFAAIKGDRHRLLQVLSNLLDNAIKFTPEGGSIRVTCEPYRDSVRFQVKDTGPGIEQQHLNRIFDLFWQAKPTAHMGAGFGLAIAKAIVEQHGGRIWAESTPGLGTKFVFTVPQAGAHEEQRDRELAG